MPLKGLQHIPALHEAYGAVFDGERSSIDMKDYSIVGRGHFFNPSQDTEQILSRNLLDIFLGVSPIGHVNI